MLQGVFMKSKTCFFLSFFILLPILFINNLNSQKTKKVFKAYLVVNNISEKLKNDSLFNTNLRLEVKNILKKKNFVLIQNNEMEEADRSYLYIYVTISDSLKISARKSTVMANVITIPYPEKTHAYKNKTNLINYVIQYIKKYL
jgi:hypothetical protein